MCLLNLFDFFRFFHRILPRIRPDGEMVDVRPLQSMEVLLGYDLCEAMGTIPPNTSIRETVRHMRGVHETRGWIE